MQKDSATCEHTTKQCVRVLENFAMQKDSATCEHTAKQCVGIVSAATLANQLARTKDPLTRSRYARSCCRWWTHCIAMCWGRQT